MNSLNINLTAENGNAKIEFLLNGKQIKGLFAINLMANTRTGELIADGLRFKLDQNDRFFVDKKTNDTAIEGINVLALLHEGFSAAQIIKEGAIQLDKQLQDISDTSKLRARNLIKERM